MTNQRHRMTRGLALALALTLAACATAPKLPPPLPADSVDLERFSGKWYVIANIPASGERERVGAYVDYTLGADGSIVETYYAFGKDFAHPRGSTQSTAVVTDAATHAQWHFEGSHWADRVIVYVDRDYQDALIADASRDRVWILARQRYLGDEVYSAMLARLEQIGYDSRRVLKVPQRPEFIGAPGFQ
ncbi:MAG TPA: lipocalin family protein [Candidatus Binatia bacterium]|nr:lipocalin family protein [Candidatus Binatia bacterium]